MQKLLKSIHTIFASVLLGSVCAILVLIILKDKINGGHNLFLIDLSIYDIFNYLTVFSFYVLLYTGFIYSIFTKWGFFKHRWIIFKWMAAVLAFIVVWIGMDPVVNGMAALADSEFKITGSYGEYISRTDKSFAYSLLVGLIFLSIVIISIFKPWGRRTVKINMSRKWIITIGLTVMIVLTSFLIMQTMILREFRQMEIADTDLSRIADGEYRGDVTLGGFTYAVNVRVANHEIISAETIRNRRSAYAHFAEGVLPRIIQEQNANVAAITGATTTSKVLMKAIETAIISAWLQPE